MKIYEQVIQCLHQRKANTPEAVAEHLKIKLGTAMATCSSLVRSGAAVRSEKGTLVLRFAPPAAAKMLREYDKKRRSKSNGKARAKDSGRTLLTFEVGDNSVTMTLSEARKVHEELTEIFG